VVYAKRIEHCTLEDGFEPMFDVALDRGEIGGADRVRRFS
jgi:hypothetical protein